MNAQENICQSCGMPMAAKEHFGTNRDETSNSEYCCFCFREGEFTDKLSFMEFVLDSVNNNVELMPENDQVLSQDELILKETVRLEQLKRWRSHQKTHMEYYSSVYRVVEHIRKNLSSTTLNLVELASCANISEFHFHRIFKSIMNESPGEYIQRLRLEKAAFKLQTTTLSLAEIAEETGYQSLFALSKAFKKKFGVTPSSFRNFPAELNTPLKQPVVYGDLNAEIKEIKPKTVISVPVIDPYKKTDAFLIAWKKIVEYISLSGVPDEENEYLCVSWDLSTLTKPEHCRIYACINTPQAIKPKGQFGKQTIDGGVYAVFTYKGSHRALDDLYCSIYRYWIPKSNYRLRDTLCFEKYLNNPSHVKENEILTEIYIPVELIKN